VDFEPDQLRLIVLEGQARPAALRSTVPLTLISGISNTECRSGVICTLSMGDTEPLEFCFKPADSMKAIMKAHHKERNAFAQAVEVARLACLPAAQPPPQPLPQPPPQPATSASQLPLTARARKGRQLSDLLDRVIKLRSNNQITEAERLLASAVPNSSAGSRTITERARELREVLFSFGGLQLTKSALARFLEMPKVKLLLPDAVKQTQMEIANTKTATLMLETAVRFLHEVLAAKGRRSDDDRNAFWASVVSLLPADLLRVRGQCAAAMRLLKVPYRTVKAATAMRGELEDRQKGWKRICSSGHADKVDGAIIAKAWHDEELSTEDNFHKVSYAIYSGVSGGDEQYDIHWRRAQEGNDKDSLRRFKASHFAHELREATKTVKRPEGVACSLKLLRQYKCKCIQKRSASECDCKICTLADTMLARWNQARHSWRTSWRKAADGSLYRPPPCTCAICSDPNRSTAYRDVSKSIHNMMKILLPCGRMEYAPYALDAKPFSFFDGRCCYGKCPRKEVAYRARFLGTGDVPKVCGWASVFGDGFCALEADSQPFSWQTWEPRLRGKNADGEPTYADELVPKHGTRAEFMAELRRAIEVFMPHWWDHVMMQRGIKVHETHKDSVTATIRSDYAAQIKTIRVHSATCAHAETHNLCVTVVGHSPYEETVHVKAHGKRKAHTKTVRKQRVAVFFGFHSAGHKPSARSFNVLREDVTSLMKHGTAKHGEWFHMGRRLPGRSHQEVLPGSLSDMTDTNPIFAALERELDVTDGCAAQFNGKDNYHQVAVWKIKTGVARNHSISITMHGKNICDALANVIQAALQSAIQNQSIIDPGTRALVLWLAENRQEPSVAKVKKDGWWAIGEIYYGYFDVARFTKLAVPDAKGFNGSATRHRFVSTVVEDPEKVERDGPIDVSTAFCGCERCSRFDFRNCLMHGLGGMATRLARQTVPSVRAIGLPSQTKTLEEFARTLNKGELRAVVVDPPERGIEGDYWLCEIQGPASQATSRQAHATDLFEEGWWIVRIKWYRHITGTSPREYELLQNSTRWLSVSAIIRLDGLRFEGGGREQRSGVKVLSEGTHDVIHACM
jgi:hypothetical protein